MIGIRLYIHERDLELENKAYVQNENLYHWAIAHP